MFGWWRLCVREGAISIRVVLLLACLRHQHCIIACELDLLSFKQFLETSYHPLNALDSPIMTLLNQRALPHQELAYLDLSCTCHAGSDGCPSRHKGSRGGTGTPR